MSDKFAMAILVVDDEPFILKLNARALANLGYSAVTTCEGAQRALEHLDQAAMPPDLILLDLNMPGMDGVEFVRHLVQREYAGSVILLSGEDERVLRATEQLVRAHEIKILGHMRKPIVQDMLGDLLKKWTPVPGSRAMQARKAYGAEELRTAITNKQLINYYQPTVSLQSGHVIGVESLIRWRHPHDGLVYPDQFIGTIEESGFINDLTRLAIANALAQVRRWREETGLSLHVAVNVSMDDLGSLDFADYVAAQSAAMGVPPQMITLEVTESRLISDLRIALEVLTRLRLKRFRISIDDFGTGHSSLAQLRDIPFDELKVDRGFVHGAWSDKMVRAIFDTSATLAKQLKMHIVAEGVEDRADWNFVRQSACDVAQGFFIAKPMPADDLAAWIEDWEERVLSVESK